MTHIPKSGRSELCPPQTHVSRPLVDPQPDEGKLDLFSRFKRAVSDHPRVVGSILGLAQLPVFMGAAAGQQARVASLVGADGLRMGRDAESVALLSCMSSDGELLRRQWGMVALRARFDIGLGRSGPRLAAVRDLATFATDHVPKLFRI